MLLLRLEVASHFFMPPAAPMSSFLLYDTTLSSITRPQVHGNDRRGSKYFWKVAYPVDKIADDVRHIYGEHHQEADHRAILGADGMKKVIAEKKQ